MLGALAPPATPLGVGCCPIETLDFFLKFLGTFGNSLVKIRPFGLLACWPAAACCSLLLAMAQTTTNIQKCWGGKPPNIFECWWLFGPWQAAVSSKQQQASRPKGLIFTRELPKVPRKFRKIEGFYGAATPQGGWWLGGQAPPTFLNVGGCLGHGKQQQAAAGQQAKRPDFLLGNCQRCLENSEKIEGFY